MIALRPSDPRYPHRLRDLQEPPDPIWVDGDVNSVNAPAVTIVGTRRMTGYGERVAREIARACADADLVVVSGLAQGIDTAAHRGALDREGRTIAVLGEGIALSVGTLSARYRTVVPRIRERGALVSQYEPRFTAKPWTFVKRNATMAALGEAVVVVEAGLASGALITASDALRLGRTLFAVPGAFESAASAGTNALVASGAALPLTRTEDLLAAVGRSSNRQRTEVDPLLDALAAGPADLDELAARSRLPTPQVASSLATLVLAGKVEALPDGRFRRP